MHCLLSCAAGPRFCLLWFVSPALEMEVNEHPGSSQDTAYDTHTHTHTSSTHVQIHTHTHIHVQTHTPGFYISSVGGAGGSFHPKLQP